MPIRGLLAFFALVAICLIGYNLPVRAQQPTAESCELRLARTELELAKVLRQLSVTQAALLSTQIPQKEAEVNALADKSKASAEKKEP